MNDPPSTQMFVFPKWLILATIAISVLPTLLNFLGVDFGSSVPPLDKSKIEHLSQDELADAMFNPKQSTADNAAKAYLNDAAFGKLSGALLHTILEWSAFCAALFTVLLAFTHYRMKMDVITPIIGMAMFMAGSMDAFHTLAADRLIPATAANTNLEPFTWAICRTFNATIMVVGVSIIFFKGLTRGAGLRLVAMISIAFGLFAHSVIHYCATRADLPQTMFPEAMITRPWDTIALVIFVFSALVIFPRFHRQHQSYFSAAVWLGVLPEIVTQLHMVFGSTELFDNHFNIAHFLKIVAYLVPCSGLILDYVHTYREEQKLVGRMQVEIEKRSTAEAALQEKTVLLEESNKELQQFAFVASHDLQEPLRKIVAFGERLEIRYGDQLDERGSQYIKFMADGGRRMQALVQSLLSLSKIDSQGTKLSRVDCNDVLRLTLADLQAAILDCNAVVAVDTLPVVSGDAVQLGQVFQNLIGNAIKFRGEAAPVIQVTAEEQDRQWQFTVKDNGIGIDPQFADRIFTVFQRLHGRAEYEGTGIGLAVCKKIVERHAGRIWIDSSPGNGSAFHLTLPKWSPEKSE